MMPDQFRILPLINLCLPINNESLRKRRLTLPPQFTLQTYPPHIFAKTPKPTSSISTSKS